MITSGITDVSINIDFCHYANIPMQYAPTKILILFLFMLETEILTNLTSTNKLYLREKKLIDPHFPLKVGCMWGVNYMGTLS